MTTRPILAKEKTPVWDGIHHFIQLHWFFLGHSGQIRCALFCKRFAHCRFSLRIPPPLRPKPLQEVWKERKKATHPRTRVGPPTFAIRTRVGRGPLRGFEWKNNSYANLQFVILQLRKERVGGWAPSPCGTNVDSQIRINYATNFEFEIFSRNCRMYVGMR